VTRSNRVAALARPRWKIPLKAPRWKSPSEVPLRRGIQGDVRAREQAGLTQEQLATRMRTKKSAISRIENHAENIGLATLEKYATALGKRVHLSVS